MRLLVTGWDDAGTLNHQDHGAFGSPGPMPDSFGHAEPIALCELDSAVFEIDKQPSFDDIEELILVVVRMPDILALDNSQADHTIVDAAERLVVPGVRIRIDQRLRVDELERRETDVQVRVECALGFHNDLRACGCVGSC